jgi:predicted DCC family thiol-disulfide oxidoreductase YuxK
MSPTTEPPAVVLFDGECNLCNGAVLFCLRHDPQGRLHYASLQSAAAKALLAPLLLPSPLPDSIVLVQDGRAFLRSSAALRIAKLLRWPWPVFTVFLLVPRPLRDFVYDFIARRRHKWFGRRESCMVPTPALRDRFLDAT